jgi:hypothetical protein
METKCINCTNIINNPNIKFSCSHFLCNKCLSRKLLLQKFRPLSSKDLIEIECTCKGKAEVSFKACLDNISGPEVKKNSSKICKDHNMVSIAYCPSCKKWLCEKCIYSYHNNLFKNHKLSYENKSMSAKCFYHKDYKNDIFCKTCNKLICKKCQNDESNTENNHKGHTTVPLEDYKKSIKNMKSNMRFKNYDQILKFIDKKQDEITNDFNSKCDKSEKIIDEAIQTLQKIKNEYISKYRQKKENLKNTFLIIKKVYNNFYSELEQENCKIDLSSFDFISKINQQLSNISYKPKNFEKFEQISTALNQINKDIFYDIKFDFSKMKYEKFDSIDLEEGVTVLCPLRCVKNSFACGTEKGKIKIYTKNTEDNEYAESGSWSIDKDPSKTESITSLIEPKKMDNILIAASSDKKLRVLTISNNNDKCTISSVKKEFDNNGIILDIFELNDGRISFSTSDGRIKIWNLNEEYNYNKIIEIKNKDVGFEKCLSEIQIFENDENNKQLVSGGGNINKNEKNGVLKKWDINSGKLEEALLFDNTKSITCITIINNHKLALGSDEGIIIIYDSFNKGGITTIIGHKNYINSMYYLNTNHTLFSCSKDLNIKIWNLDSLQCINTLKKQHTSNIYDIILCNNDLISCSNDHYVNIYTIDDTGDNNDANEENYDDFN